MIRRDIRRITYKILLVITIATTCSTAAQAQLWRTRLRMFTPDTSMMVIDTTTVSLDSISPADTSLIDMQRFEAYYARWKAEREGNISPKPDMISFYVIAVPYQANIQYRPPNYKRRQLIDYKRSIRRSSAVREAHERLDNMALTIDEVRQQYAAGHPENVKYSWIEIPEPYKDIRDGKKINHRKDEIQLLAEEFGSRQDNNVKIKSLPKEEESPWTVSGEENVQLSQLFLANWVAGGETSLTLLSDMRFKAAYAKDPHSWENELTHKMGFTQTKALGFRVTNDAFNLSSKYGYKAVSTWYYSVKNTFKTQLFRKYDDDDEDKEDPLSSLLSPAYIQFILGMDYKKTDLSVLLSPYTLNITLVMDTAHIDPSDYSIPDGHKSDVTTGFSVTVTWKKKFTEDITYTTETELFMEYFEKGGQKQFDWENVIDIQINRFLTTRFLLELRYYDNESTKFQMKENFSVAFKYSF